MKYQERVLEADSGGEGETEGIVEIVHPVASFLKDSVS